MRNIFIILAIILASTTARADEANPADHNSWKVTANSYQYSMTITTALVFDMEESRDVNDKIAVFVGNDCRGVAKPITYVPESDRYLAHLLVYGNVVQGDIVTLYMYDASEDRIVQVAKKIEFAPNATFGTVADPYMSITTFNVSFNVGNGINNVPGAFVTLGDYGSRFTDEDGNVEFENISPSTDIAYSVVFEGYDTVEESLSVSNSDVNKDIKLTCSFTFNVSDGVNSVESAEVFLEGYGSKITDSNGDAKFSELEISENIIFKVELEKYNYYEGSIAVGPLESKIENVIINLTRYNVDFNITNNGNKLNGVKIILDGYGENITDENGYVRFDKVLPSEGITYSINSSIHDNKNNSVAIIDQDVVLNIDLNLTGYKVSFSIIDGNIPVENAKVHLSGYDIKTSDINGNVVFDKVILDNNIVYEVTTETHNFHTGNISVVDKNISEKVSLRLSTFNAEFNVDDGIKAIEGTEIEIEVAGNIRKEDFDNSIIPEYFASIGNNTWGIDDQDVFQGVYTIKSGEIFDNQFSEIVFERKTIAGNFSFFMKVSSEQNSDYLIFYIDGEEKGRWSGDSGWKQQTFNLESGTHTFKWEYKKDGSRKGGGDCAWVDYIKYPSEEMEYLKEKTDIYGRAIFTDLLPQDIINYTILDDRYSNYKGDVSIFKSNQEENISLKVDLKFTIKKEFNGKYQETDYIELENYGKMFFNDKGLAIYENVNPTEIISYSIFCNRYNDAHGDIGALINNSTNVDIDISRFNVEFNLSYEEKPLTGLEIILENNGKQKTDENGNVVFEDVVPANLNFEIDHDNFMLKEGMVLIDDKDVKLSQDVLPVYYLSFNVRSGSKTGNVPVHDAVVTLTKSGKALNTANIGEVEFNEITPHNRITFTIEADGYLPYSGEAKITHTHGEEGTTQQHDVLLEYDDVFEAANFISPNSDGRNDYWEIYDVEKYDSFTVEIYSTTGEIMYKTTNYKNYKWDGKNNGKSLPNGVYYYLVTSPEKDHVFKGIINLVN